MAERRRASLPTVWAAATVLAAVGVAAGVPGGRITAPKVAGSLAQSFGRRYVLQQQDAGLGGIALPSTTVSAVCTRPGRGAAGSTGPGDDWACTVAWQSAGRIASARYDLQIHPNGCYVADGPAGIIGGPTLRSPTRGTVMNPLYEFDGCVTLS